MNRKITLLALAGRGGALGDMGLTNGVDPSAATACRARNPSPPSRPASATAPKPPPISQMTSRRVRPQNEDERWGLSGWARRDRSMAGSVRGLRSEDEDRRANRANHGLRGHRTTSLSVIRSLESIPPQPLNRCKG